MSAITHLLDAAAAGDSRAAADLLPLVYDELRTLAAHHLAGEKPGHTLQATALVHEAYLRLVGPADAARWHHRGHFFAAAAEAMRRILVDAARRKGAGKRGGGLRRVDLDAAAVTAPGADDDLLALDDALARLAVADPQAADLVKLRFFAGLTVPEAAAALGVSPPHRRLALGVRPRLAPPRPRRAGRHPLIGLFCATPGRIPHWGYSEPPELTHDRAGHLHRRRPVGGRRAGRLPGGGVRRPAGPAGPGGGTAPAARRGRRLP